MERAERSNAVLLSVMTVTALLATGICTRGQPRTEIYELQERCGKRATEIFENDFPKNERKGLENFENHYSVRLNKCFMLETNTVFTREDGKSTSFKFLTLIDVNENKAYGSFSILGCDVGERKCRSEEEFRTLIRPYMEE